MKFSGMESSVFIAAMIAAPVGVINSPFVLVKCSFKSLALTIFTTAGTGIGIAPCWQLTKPLPSDKLEQNTLFMFNLSMQIAAAVISTIESTAPTS